MSPDAIVQLCCAATHGAPIPLVPSRTPRWRKAAVAVVAFLVTLELTLQIGALVMAMFLPPAERAGPGPVLCVGDSFTFGVGATSPASSYPGQLTAALAARGLPGIAVSNAGFPGQHSGDVLSKLPGQLTPTTKVLCVLVGANDSWRHPARVDPAELAAQATTSTGSSFQWCWRTARLFQLITQFDAKAWQQTGDGKAAAKFEANIATAADQTAAAMENGFLALAKCGLVTSNAPTGRYAPDRTLPSARNDAFRQRMEAGDFPQACATAEQSAHDHPDSPLALQQVVAAAARTGQRDKALAAIDRLVKLGKTHPTAAATECLADAYLTSGQPDLAIATAAQRIAEQPLSIVAWDSLQQAAFVLGRREDALQAMPETFRLLGRSQPSRSAFIARNFARFWLESDPDKATGLLVGAWLVDRNVEETRIAFMVAAPVIERRRFEAAVAAIGDAEHAALRVLAAILDDVYAGKGADEWGTVLREHLVAMHALAQRRGITMVILGYPFHQQQVEQNQRAAAQALGVPFVAIGERFDRELRTRTVVDLFVPDGHCNDAGYAILAEMVAQAVAPLLTK